MKKSKPSTMLKNLMAKKLSLIKEDEMEEITYQPKSVKELLIEMMDKSELIVDLAYSALIFDSADLALKVREMEVDMDELLYQVRISAMLAARNTEEAEQLSGVLHFANAVENISDAAMNIVDVFYSSTEKNVTPLFSFLFEDADEKMRAVLVNANSSIAGKKIGDLKVESETGVRIIAIKRNNRWLYDVGGGTRIHAGDFLLLRGVEGGIKEFEAYASGEVPWGRYREKKQLAEETKPISKIVYYLMKMKNLSELMVDLAVSSLVYNNREIAEEVYVLYHDLSKLYDKVLKYVIRKMGQSNTDLAASVISVINGMYEIGDSAKGIANVVVRDMEPHPIIKQIVKESDSAIIRVKVYRNSPMDGKTLGELHLATETGLWMFAIKRNDSWIFGPNEGTRIQADDIIFLKGPVESFNVLYELAGCLDSCEVEE